MASNPGPLLWRVPITRITVDIGGGSTYVPLDGSQASGVYSIYPVGVLDSGSTTIIATRALANAIYGTWGIGPGKDDGQYYIPCTTSMNVTLTIGSGASVNVPLHPLDLSTQVPSQPDSSSCLGLIQATDSTMAQGDIILGLPFMRNVYSVLSYDTNPPKLGLLPITNPQTALSEFNTVRIQKQQLGDGLSPSQGGSGNSTSTAKPTSDNSSTGVGLKVLGAVLGVLVLAGLALFFTVRTLRPRWKRQQEEDAAKGPQPRDMEVGGREKRAAAARSVWGLEFEDGYNMFSSGAPPKDSSRDSDSGSIKSFTNGDGTTKNQRGGAHDGEADIALQTLDHDDPAGPKVMHRRPPYQTIDSDWGSGSMSGLLKDPRYMSGFSFHSTQASVNGSNANLASMPPIVPTDQYLPTTHNMVDDAHSDFYDPEQSARRSSVALDHNDSHAKIL